MMAEARGLLLTAMPLTPQQHSDIEAKFSALLDTEVSLTECMDRKLIGGIRVELLGRVYDGSVQGQLRLMLKTLQDEEDVAHA